MSKVLEEAYTYSYLRETERGIAFYGSSKAQVPYLIVFNDDWYNSSTVESGTFTAVIFKPKKTLELLFSNQRKPLNF